MSLQVNHLKTVQDDPKAQMHRIFGANPVVSTDKLERTPSSDILIKPNQNKTNKILSTLGVIASIGIGLVTAGVVFKRWNPKPIKQLAENIQFVKADKIEDAIKFAQENLGVKLDVNGQLKTANWINESLVNLSNKAKGKVLLPKSIKICKLPKGLAGRYKPFSRTVKLSENSFGTYFERDFEKVQKMGNLQDRLETLYHEIGHGVHLTKSNIFNAIFGTPKFNKTINPYKDELIDFLGQGRIDPKHYISSEGETFSQLFALKMTGQPFSNNVEKVCQSLGL